MFLLGSSKTSTALALSNAEGHEQGGFLGFGKTGVARCGLCSVFAVFFFTEP